MKLSIITINLNNAEGLRRTLQSIVSQTYVRQTPQEVEVIVVDGGSTDGSQALFAELCTSKPSTEFKMSIISEPDKGVYDAQNKGILLAQGEYCYFLNSGDWLVSGNVLEQILVDANADIVYGNELVVDSAGQVIERCYGIKNPSFLQLYQSCMKHQATFIRRKLFQTYGLYDIEMRICSDWDWFLRVLGYHKEIKLDYRDIDVAYFRNDGISYSRPDICAKENQLVKDRYLTRSQQRLMKIWALWAKITKFIKKKL